MGTPIVVGIPRPTPWFTPVFVALDRGFLAEEGLDATIEQGGRFEKLTDGRMDYVASSPGRSGILESGGVTMVCGRAEQGSHVLMIRREVGVDRIEHLVQQGTGQGEPRLANELAAVLARYGVNLDTSGIELTGAGPEGHKDQYAMLQEGIGDGALLGPPYWIYLSKQGYVNHGGAVFDQPGLSASGIYVSPEKISSNPDQIQAFVRAYVRANQFCKDHPAEALETMMKFAAGWGVDNIEIAREVYEWAEPHWKVEVDPDAIQRLLTRSAERSGKPPLTIEEFLDLRFLNEALKTLGRE